MAPRERVAPNRVDGPRGELVDGRDLTAGHPVVGAVIGLATAGSIGLVVRIHWADPGLAVLLGVVVACYGALSIVDAAEQRLPNRLTVPLAIATAVAVTAGGLVRSDPGAGLGAIGAGLVFAGVLMLLRFGMGDVKLGLTVGTIAAWLGLDAVVATVYAGALSGAAMALTLMAIHRRRDLSFGFGPFLALGSVAGMIVAGS